MKHPLGSTSQDPDGKIAALVETLYRTQQQLQELAGGEVDAVIEAGGQPYLLRNAQEKLRHSEATQRELAWTLRSILDALPANIALLDRHGVILEANRGWRDFAECDGLQDASSEIGQNYLECCEGAQGEDADYGRRAAAGIRAVLAGSAEDFSLEYPCHAPETPRWFRLMVTPLKGERMGGAAVMHLDITKRKLAESALHRSEERFRGFFEHSAVGMTHVSPENTLRTVNDRFCDIVGYSREELEGRSVLEITVEEDRSISIEKRRALVAGEVPFYSLEKRYLRKTRERIWVRITSTLVPAFEGEGVQTLTVVEDITARKRSEARLLRLNRLHVALRKLGEEAAKAPGPQELYDSMCRIMVAEGRLRSSWIVEEVDAPPGQRLSASYGSVPVGHVQIDRSPDEFYPGGEALRTGGHEVYNDFARDGRTEPWRDWGRRHGILAAAAFPIRRGRSVVAAMVVLAGEKAYFEEDEVHLMLSAANEVSFMLEAHQREQQRESAERALRASEAGMAAAQAIAHFGSWELDLSRSSPTELGTWRWSDEMFRIAGLLPGSIEATADLFFDLIPLEERPQVQAAIATAIARRQDLSVVHRVRQPKGEERIVQETARLFIDEHTGQILRMVGTAHDITGQRHSQEAIRMQAQMLDQIGQAVITTDLEGYVTYVNRFACELYRCAADSMLGREMIDVTAARYTDEQTRERTARLRAGAGWSGEYLVQACDGRVFPAYVTDSPLLDERGGMIGVVSISSDIGARKHAQALLEKSEREQRQLATQLDAERARLLTAQAIAKIGSWEVDLATSAVIGSAELFRILHLHPDAIAGGWRTALDFVHPDDRERLGETFMRSMEECGAYEFEHRIVLADGRVKFMHQRWQIVPGAEGAPVRAIGTCQDITERKRADERLAEQAALIDGARDAIVVRDLNHRVTYWNKSAERLYGWTSDEAVGRSVREVLRGEPALFETALRAVLESGEWVGELPKEDKAGRKILVESRWTLVRDEAGKPRAVFAIDTDITERKQLEQQFLRSQRMESIGTLAGGIAHDLNNALTPINMAVNLLRTKFSNPEADRLLGVIGTSAERGADMVRQLLSFARGVDGRKVEVQVKHLLGEIKKIADETFLKHVRVQTNVPADLRTITGDPTQIHQVFLNLCVNARDAMPKGGTIVVSAENMEIDAHYAALHPDVVPGPYVYVSFEDNGTGIPREVVDRIFDPFFTTKEVGKGTGLGLSTSLAIVKSHGGFISVNSESGKGTTFKVGLPARLEQDGGTTAGAASELLRGNGELILVVDDEAPVREITRSTLEAAGYRAILAADGAEAVAIYAGRGAEIAVVFTDMMMPEMDGPTSVQILRKMNPAVRVICASGLSTQTNVAQHAFLDPKYFLPKPYTAEALLTMLHQLLAVA